MSSADICPHIFSTDVQAPRLSHAVHREECTLCFDGQDSPDGVDVCLTCYNGGCNSEERHHARSHWEKSGHPMVVNIRRTRKPEKERDDEEPPLKKLAIQEVKEEDVYDFHFLTRCYACGGIPVDPTPDIQRAIDGIMSADSSARQSEIQAWEEEITACEHTLCLEQGPPKEVKSAGATCSQCELGENLWLCLTCGSLGCGRPQFGGGGGNGHGLAHFDQTAHPVALKLGTITPEGTADIYCYSCNDARIDPELKAHCATFGIHLASQIKTEKSMTELQLEHNIKFDFSMTGDDGKELQPLYGPGLTGLKNLGNSCYLASTIQAVFALPAFQQAYYLTDKSHTATCSLPPDSCFTCQLRKVADGLLSGRYSHPSKASKEAWQEGLKPNMLKELVGKGHEEFASMRQQDAEEFFQHLLKTLRADAQKQRSVAPGSGSEPTDVFRFGLEQRLQCTSCLGVRYRTDEQDSVSVPVAAVERGHDDDGKLLYETVRLDDCIEQALEPTELEYNCPSCKKTVTAVKQSRFTTFPDVLAIHAKKFQLVNWVPQKLDVPLEFGAEIDLSKWKGSGLIEGEIPLPEDEAAGALDLPMFDEAALGLLQGMGFPLIRCQKALLATGNSDGEAAMEWLFAHMDDPDIDSPLKTGAMADSTSTGPSIEQISMLVDMGFSPAQARKALRVTSGGPDAAVEWLFANSDDPCELEPPAAELGAPATPASAPEFGGSLSLPAKYRLKAFINHKGPSVHSGHYVATIEQDSSAVLFNDEKVAKSEGSAHDNLKQAAYLYIFERVAAKRSV